MPILKSGVCFQVEADQAAASRFHSSALIRLGLSVFDAYLVRQPLVVVRRSHLVANLRQATHPGEVPTYNPKLPSSHHSLIPLRSSASTPVRRRYGISSVVHDAANISWEQSKA